MRLERDLDKEPHGTYNDLAVGAYNAAGKALGFSGSTLTFRPRRFRLLRSGQLRYYVVSEGAAPPGMRGEALLEERSTIALQGSTLKRIKTERGSGRQQVRRLEIASRSPRDRSSEPAPSTSFHRACTDRLRPSTAFRRCSASRSSRSSTRTAGRLSSSTSTRERFWLLLIASDCF